MSLLNKPWVSQKMPISDHSFFPQVESTAKLWRYTDIAKLLALIVDQRLWLANAEILAADDPYESFANPDSFTHRTWSTINDVPTDAFNAAVSTIPNYKKLDPAPLLQLIKEKCEEFLVGTRGDRATYFVSCWHKSYHESVAMWKVYGALNAGVAVQTTPERIASAFAGVGFPIFLGEVQYADVLHPVPFKAFNLFSSVMVKRKAFEYEKEVRIVCWNQPPIDKVSDITYGSGRLPEDKYKHANGLSNPTGLFIKCDISALIEKILISPYAPPWYASLIEKVLEMVSVTAPVETSDLLQDPAHGRLA